MVYQHHEPAHAPHRSVERHFVQIFNHDIVVVAGEVLSIVALSDERIGVTSSDAMDFYSAQGDAPRNVRPRAAQQIDAVSASNNATEDLLKMKLGATSLRIGEILPVEN